MKNVLKINHENRTIVMDRTFAKMSTVVGSPEYNMLQMARRDYPEYAVTRREIKKNPNKESYRGLTYEYMENYILTHPQKEMMLKKFKEMIILSECHSIRYPQIKKWFLESYPEVVNYFAKTDETNEAKAA